MQPSSVLAGKVEVCQTMSTNSCFLVAQGSAPQGDRAHSHYKATTSVRDVSDCEAWQPPGYQAGPSKSGHRPNSNRGPSTEADTRPHSKHSILAPADTATWPGTAARRGMALNSQQGSLQGSDKDMAPDNHQWLRSSPGSSRVDPPARDLVDRDLAARDYGEPPAGLSNSRRLEQQAHQHKLQRPSAELGTSKGLHSGKGLPDTVPAAKPYATEQSLKVASKLA